MVTTALDVRLEVILRLQSFLRHAQPGTEIPDAAEHAILLALNPRRKAVNGPFLFRNVLRDARRILTRRGREVSLDALAAEAGPRSTSCDALAEGVEHHDDRGHERLQALCHLQTPDAIVCAKELENNLRRQLNASHPGAGYCLDGLLAGEKAAETAARTGLPLPRAAPADGPAATLPGPGEGSGALPGGRLMAASVTICAGVRRRLAFPLLPCVVKGMIPRGVIGVYLLVRDALPVYVGRSDHCLRCRLAAHELLGSASHFFWEPFPDALRAFHFESIWFHRLAGKPGFLNRAHPARPSGHSATCPFCDTRDTLGLVVALRA